MRLFRIPRSQTWQEEKLLNEKCRSRPHLNDIFVARGSAALSTESLVSRVGINSVHFPFARFESTI